LDALVRATGTSYSTLTRDFIAKHGGKTLLDRYGSVSKLIKAFYPDAKFEQTKFLKLSKLSKSQRYLTDVIRSIIGPTTVLTDYRHQDLLFQGAASIIFINFTKLTY
jgi:hypothetical protein